MVSSPVPRRHPKSERAPALRIQQPKPGGGQVKRERRSRSPRSKSPLKRAVKFSDQDKVIPPVPASSGKEQPGMRMKEAREAVPRKEGETRLGSSPTSGLRSSRRLQRRRTSEGWGGFPGAGQDTTKGLYPCGSRGERVPC